MSDGPQFFQTPMGRRFYESDVPRIASALERIAKAMETANQIHQARPADPDNLNSGKDEHGTQK